MTQRAPNIKCYKSLKEFLCKPIEWFQKDDSENFKIHLIMYLFIFLITGIILNTYYTFPHFELYFCIFIGIAVIVWKSIEYFSTSIREIVTNLRVIDDTSVAYDYYDKYICRNSLYIILPCIILIVFGGGGISMSDAIVCDLLLFWVMSLFTLVVYISIIGYVEFFLLAIFIYKLSVKECQFTNLPHSLEECVPADIEWIQKITKLAHWYQAVFFLVGSLYIIAFGAFCQLPEFNANRNSLAFYILWGVIFIAIVLAFPVITFLEHNWIKKIVKKVKNTYILDIHKEADRIMRSSQTGKMSKLQIQLWEEIYAFKIIESRDYPIVSTFNKAYGICFSIFNFFASTYSVIGGVPTVLSALQQIL